MRFLSGLLKVLSIILIIASTMICTAICVAADDLAAYLVMGSVWIGCILVSLSIWGTGLALSSACNLRKRVDALEQRSLYYQLQQKPAAVPAPSAAVPAPENMPDDGPTSVLIQPQQPAAKSPLQKWLPVIIGGGIALVAVVVMLIVIASSGSKDDISVEAPENYGSEVQVEATMAPEDATPNDLLLAILESGEISPDEIDMYIDSGELGPDDLIILVESGIVDPNSLSDMGKELLASTGYEISETAAPAEMPTHTLGECFGVPFVEFTFSDFEVNKDIKHKVTIGNVTRITGPDPVDGQQYVCLTGMICNTSTSPLPVYDFFNGRYVIDGYTYDLDSTNYDVLDGEGQTVSEIDPLMEYKLRVYVAIPDRLADSFSDCSFSFGFYDEFDNKELSYNRSFGDDAIAPCPYQFSVILK